VTREKLSTPAVAPFVFSLCEIITSLDVSGLPHQVVELVVQGHHADR
jgi:hypothetical protein